MADCLPSPVKEIGKCIWDCFLKPHVDYWWCFDDNFQQLNGGIVKLKRKIEDIETAWRLTSIRPAKVEKWLNDSTKKLEEARRILPNGNIPGNIPKWDIRSRYSLGKNAKETAEDITKLLKEEDLIQIEHPAPSPAMASPSTRLTMDFESRKGIEEAIVKSLKESTVDVIGICGMGGVGKTIMAQRIWKRVKDENLFDEVVMVAVSQQIDMPKIQNEIADLLKLKFNESSMSARAHQLRTRLMDKMKKLVILDDVWESLEFQDLGIPIDSNFERCKVLLTSRSKDTCKTIKNKQVFDLKTLEEKEAWILFKEKAGECVENSALNHVPKSVAAECKCLPIALVTVGLYLQGETDISIWKNALSQLRKSNPTDLPKVIRDVYLPLKLSYDNLDTHVDQCFFLLCSLFPEDYHIPVEQLTWYSMGLPMFDDISSIEEATNKAHALVGKLKMRCLLIDGSDKLHVKMHDVTRDVAIYILKSLTSIKNLSDVNCNWMSVDISNGQMEVPLLSRFPKLQLLMWSSKAFYDICHLSFEGMEDLKVLSFEDISIGSLPPTLGSLKNLHTLRLVKCNVKNISVIGKLTSLNILSCCRCANITELPAEIGSMSGLRLLELSDCFNLQRIPFGVISSLGRLEELKMRRSFSRWEAEKNGKDRGNASLTELGSLPNLSCLDIEIDDCTLSAQEIRLSQKLVKYYIRIGSKNNNYYYYYSEVRDYQKVMILNLPSDIGAVGKWIQERVRNTELLHLEGDGSNNFNIAEIEYLRNLRVTKCSTVKKLDIVSCSLDTLRLDDLENLEEIIGRTIIPNQNGCIEFPKLKHLALRNLPKLNSLSFLKDDSCSILKSINISKCDKLRSLCSVPAARTCLLQLEILRIKSCESMEQVFWNEGTDHNTDGCIEFPKLKELTLKHLPKLNSLSFLKDYSCCNLKYIYISKRDKLRSLCSVSAARTCLLQLEILRIKSCESMEEVFWNEGTDVNTDGCIEFPKLKELRLEDLRNLTAFCQGLENKSIKFPSLTTVSIFSLPKLNSMFSLNSETLDGHTTSLHFFKDDSCCNLNCVYISKCDKLRSLCTVSAARTCLLQLEDLHIEFCDSMEQVFWNEGTDDNTDGCIEFPKLKELTLTSLPNLTAFSHGLENIKFPNLRVMGIGGLPKLNSLCPLNSETLVVHDQNISLHFVCNAKVEMGCLKYLKFSNFQDNIRNIWCHQISDNVFNNLTTLSIHTSNGIRSLMSTSIAKNLMSLEALFIHDCGELVEVIERDEDDDEQVVDINCLFPTLIQLRMWGLPKLKKFWQWNHALELPLLKRVSIDNCPIMETFTLGSINTPNINELWVNDQQVRDQKDLNDVIRHIWTEGQDKSKANGDGNGNGNEYKNKDESKDEYNNENVNKDDDSNEMN